MRGGKDEKHIVISFGEEKGTKRLDPRNKREKKRRGKKMNVKIRGSFTLLSVARFKGK